MSRNPSKYAKNISRLSAQIFGEPLPEHAKTSRKVIELLSKKPIRSCKEVVKYYPPSNDINRMMRTLRHLGLYVDEHLDFSEEMARQRNLRKQNKA